mmetsp:Transcript_75620/g.133457  ORF Transcript_75620/g.133457 Transcript_75620/m.133457 type:complete len:115 (-) Transcript_75620:85-429(-)
MYMLVRSTIAFYLFASCAGVEVATPVVRRHEGSHAAAVEVGSTADPVVVCPANYIGTPDCKDPELASSKEDCEKFYEETNQDSFKCEWKGGACVASTTKCTKWTKRTETSAVVR